MSFINYHTKEINYKIIYCGPSLSGKTTSLKCIYENFAQDGASEIMTLDANKERTLFFDFLPLELGQVGEFKAKFHLYSVPGQLFYEEGQKILFKGIDGVVFVADSQVEQMEENIKSLAFLEQILSLFNYKLKSIPMIMQFNKRDIPNISSEKAMNIQLNKWDVPVFCTNAKTGEGIINALQQITKQVVITSRV